jgi:FkbM family methyltransferase
MAAGVELARAFVDSYDRRTRFDMRVNGEQLLLDRLGSRLDVVFDVGANVGDWTHEALSSGARSVHAFEIAPETAHRLSERYEGDERVVVNRFGLLDQPGTVTIRHYPEWPALTTTTAFPHSARFVEIEVPVETGDSYILRSGIDRIDFVKIDVEGADHLVLGGLTDALRRGCVSAVQFEFGLGHALSRVLLKDFYDLLGGHGFEIGPIYPDGVEFMDYTLYLERSRVGNFFAVRSDRHDMREQVALERR